MPVLGMPDYKITAFIASNTSITPPEISRYFEGSFLKPLPAQNPATDIKNEVKPIKQADNIKGDLVKLRLTPDARASMLVASPMPIRHFRPIQQILSSFSLNASYINFTPKAKNIVKTSHLP